VLSLSKLTHHRHIFRYWKNKLISFISLFLGKYFPTKLQWNYSTLCVSIYTSFFTLSSQSVDVAKQRRDFLYKIIEIQLTFMASEVFLVFTYVIKHTLRLLVLIFFTYYEKRCLDEGVYLTTVYKNYGWHDKIDFS